MEPTSTVYATVSGGRAGTADPTWGHRTMFRWRGSSPTQRISCPRAHASCPGGCTRAAVAGGIAHVLWRYDVLRTLFTGTARRPWPASLVAGDPGARRAQRASGSVTVSAGARAGRAGSQESRRPQHQALRVGRGEA